MKSNMFKSLVAALAVTGMFVAITPARAAETAEQTVTYEVTGINAIAVGGDAVSLTVSEATSGSAPTTVTHNTSSYSVTTNETNRKITAELGEDMPFGVTLTVLLDAPAGAAASNKTLTTAPEDVVTGITKLNEENKTITYSLSATAAAGSVSGSRTVTFTIVAGE